MLIIVPQMAKEHVHKLNWHCSVVLVQQISKLKHELNEAHLVQIVFYVFRISIAFIKFDVDVLHDSLDLVSHSFFIYLYPEVTQKDVYLWEVNFLAVTLVIFIQLRELGVNFKQSRIYLQSVIY